MARNVSVAGWNSWSESSTPKGIGKDKVIVLSVIGNENRSNALNVLSNEEYTHDPLTGDQFMIGPIDKPGKPDAKGVVEPVLFDLWLTPAQQKTWTLIGGRRKDEAIWEFIQKSSQFSGYKYRDDSAEPILELIDLDAPLKASLKARKKTRAAEKYVDGLSDVEVRSHFGGGKQDIEILRERLILQAESNPAQFEADVDKNANLEVKACVIQADKDGIIEFDKDGSKWMMDGEELFSFKKGVGKGMGKYDKMVDYINTQNQGLFDELLTRLS